MSAEGRRLWAEVDEAAAALDAAEEANRLLPYTGQQKAHDRGGSIHRAAERDAAARAECWRFHESAAADVDDVAGFILRTGKAPRIPAGVPADERIQLQVRNMVAAKFEEERAVLHAGIRGMIAEVVTAFGHDPEDAGSKAIIAAAIKRYDAANPMRSSPPAVEVASDGQA